MRTYDFLTCAASKSSIQLCYREFSISHFFLLLESSGHITPFGWNFSGDYIYSPLTVTHAREALRNLLCWLGIALIRFALRVFTELNPLFNNIIVFSVCRKMAILT